MERGSGSLGKRPLEDESSVKKQSKSRWQVQILREAYSEDPSPPTWKKEELARMTGLDYMQIQNWFGNRRYLDKHGPRRHKPTTEHDGPPGGGKSMQVASEFNPCTTSTMPLVTVARAGPSLMAGSVPAAESWNVLKPQPLQVIMPAASMVQSRLQPALSLPPPVTQPMMHVEDNLRQTLRADRPILVNMEQRRALQPCDGKKFQRAQWLEIAKASFLTAFERDLVKTPFNETDVTVRDAHTLDAEAARAVHEYQFFPIEQRRLQKYESVNQTRFPVSSVNISNCVGQTSNKHAYIASSFPSQCGTSNATHQSQQGGVKITTSLAENHEAPNLFRPNCAPDDCPVIPFTQLGNPFTSSNKADSYKMKKTQIYPSGSSDINVFQQFDHARISTTAAFQDMNNNRNWNMQNQRRRDRSSGLHHGHGYDRFLVLPRERSETVSVDVTRQMSYFSDADDSHRLIIAKWNQKENQAVYIEDDSENTLSMSSGTDSTPSVGYDDDATESVKGYAEGKSLEIINVDDETTENAKGYAVGKSTEVINLDDEEDHAGKDHNGQKEIDVIGNGVDVVMEDMDYKDGEVNEHRTTSSLSSGKTP